MSEVKQNMPVSFTDKKLLKIPAFCDVPENILDITIVKNAEGRIHEAQSVNGGTYTELEFTFNEGYRESRKHLSTIGYQISLVNKEIRKVKSQLLIDEYPSWLKESGLKDSTITKDAFFNKHDNYVNALDRKDMLVALESFFEGKVKVFENVCRYMKKTIDLEIRSGIINSNKYCS